MRTMIENPRVSICRTPASTSSLNASTSFCASAWVFSYCAAFLFRPRAEVLTLLGDPATVSGYNRPAGKKVSDPLVYVFDTGFGGARYTLTFGPDGRVSGVRVEGID